MSKRSGKRSAPRAGTLRSDRSTGDGDRERETSAVDADRAVCSTCGQVHKGCNAHTKHGPNAGKPCGAQVRRGALCCPKHGGNNPNQKAKAAERLEAARQEMIDLVEPLLSRLRTIALDPDSTDADVIRVFREIANRVGLSERHVIVPGAPSEWDDLIDNALGGGGSLDRSLDSGDDHRALPSASWEDVDTFQRDAQAEAWSELEAEDEHGYRTRLDPYDGRTVSGDAEVVEDSILPGQPDTRGAPSEYDPMRWPYDRPPA